MERVCPECGTKTEELTCPNDGEMTLVVKKAKDQSLDMVGEVIGGRYRIEKVIGQGGFGAVFMAQHTATGDTVAIKVLRTDVENNMDVVARFRQEAKATSKLKHPNTVRVFDFGQMNDGNLFLAMEFLDGRTLTDMMREEAPVHFNRLVHICTQVLKSLSEAHSKGIVHRDLKPDNIYLQKIHGEEDFVRVLDFGIAKSVIGEDTNITSTGAVLGTPKYMSPEQARGQRVDQRTDLYSLGVILYEGLTGTPPFQAETPLAMILQRVTEDPPKVHDNIAMPVPVGLCDVVFKAMARNPNDRYCDANEMIEALQRALETPISVPLGPGALPVAGGPAGGTQVYGAARSDPNAALGSGHDSAAQSILIDGGNLDDATFVASPEQSADVRAAVRSVGNATALVDQDGVATVAAMLPRDGQGDYDHGMAAPRQAAPSRMPLILGGLIGVAALVGFALFGMVSNRSAGDAKTGAGAAMPAAVLAGTAAQPVAAAPVAAAPVAAAPVAAAPGAAPVAPPVAAPVAPPVAAPVAPPAPVNATVVFERDPEDATIQVDGVTVIGDKVIVPPGKHMITASRNGYKKWSQELDFAAGDAPAVKVELEKRATASNRPRPRPRHEAAAPAEKPAPKPKPRSDDLLIN